ncbi:MAG: xanthine dehydrogenase molybdopterin binding subunit, partial [Rhodospirillaceae bacterium]|nr:xanthine dehydrogenase molybdopterin binding subunit [Rhodospirillaceae bacterium]
MNASPQDERPAPVGEPLIHDSARRHVTGAALYIDDMPDAANVVHVALVLSPHPHARIRAIRAGAAAETPGFVALLTAADIPGRNDVGPVEPEPALAEDVADYVGCPVAAVAAESLAAAQAAAAKVEVDYELLPPILSIRQALAAKSFIGEPMVLVSGDDAAAAIAAAPHRMKGKLEVGGQDHFYLETHVALAVPREAGEMTIYSSTQHPNEVQRKVAEVLGVPSAAVDVEVRRLGGGFGGKESQATIFAGIAAVAASKTGRPAKLRLTRDADMAASGKRHDFLISYEVGFDGEGRILGLDVELAARAGNVADLSAAVMARALCHLDNCYHLPALRAVGYLCKTHTVSNTAFRGFGGPQGMIAIEEIVDRIARRLGVPLDEVRRRNFYGAAPRNVTPYGQRVAQTIVPALTERLLAAAEVERRRAEIAAFNRTSPILKRGLALVPVKFGIAFNNPILNQAGALVHVYADGSVHLNHGGIEMGQGLFVKVAQVAAGVFGVDIGKVRLSATRTDKVPNTSATAASTGSDLNGMAAFQAASEIRGRMAAVFAQRFGVPAEDVRFAAGYARAGNHAMRFEDLAKRCWIERVSLSAAGHYRFPGIHWDQRSVKGEPFFYFAHGAAASEVVVDGLTGETRVLRADLIHDCGASLNPAVDLGQIEGAYVQGLGWLTCEELWWAPDGTLKTIGPSTYKIPGSRDVPPVFNVHILDDAPNPAETIFRSKAVGEPPLMLAISAWLAIRDAVAAFGAPGGEV